jgi:hypothetical protein
MGPASFFAVNSSPSAVIALLAWLHVCAALLLFLAALCVHFWIRHNPDRSWRRLLVDVLSRVYPAAIQEILRRHGVRAPAATAHITARLNRCGSNNLPVLVYQMSKVGSSTVLATLEAAIPARTVFHVHFMSLSHLDEIERNYEIKAPGKPLPENYAAGRELGRQIKSRGMKTLIVTLVRDPIGRAVSSLLQAPELAFIPVFDETGRVSLDLCVESIRREAKSSQAFSYPEVWFKREMCDFFGIDVLNEPFNKDKGYEIIEHEGNRLLVLRMEDLSQTLSVALSKLLRLDREPPIRNANVRSQSREGSQYAELKRRVNLPTDWLQDFYKRRFITHFYSEEMIRGFIKKWSGDSN